MIKEKSKPEKTDESSVPLKDGTKVEDLEREFQRSLAIVREAIKRIRSRAAK